MLRELAERLEAPALGRAAEAEAEHAYAQRPGYLLDRIGHVELAAPLAEGLEARAPHVTPLRPDRLITGAPRNAQWRVAVNDEVQTDDASDRWSGGGCRNLTMTSATGDLLPSRGCHEQVGILDNFLKKTRD